MTKKGARSGGAARVRRTVDQDTASWLSGAAQNPTTVTTKQRYEQERVRANLDLHPDVKAVLTLIAERQKTSIAQAGGFLLAWAVQEYFQGNTLNAAMHSAHVPNPSPRAEYKLDLPADWLAALAALVE
jgi:hypothetical protein